MHQETQKAQKQADNISRELYQIKRSQVKNKYSVVDSSEANIDYGDKAAAA